MSIRHRNLNSPVGMVSFSRLAVIASRITRNAWLGPVRHRVSFQDTGITDRTCFRWERSLTSPCFTDITEWDPAVSQFCGYRGKFGAERATQGLYYGFQPVAEKVI